MPTRIFEARRVGAEPSQRAALARLAATQFGYQSAAAELAAGPPSMPAVPQKHASQAPATLCSSGKDAACCLRHPQACPSMSRKTPSMTTKTTTARDTATTKAAAAPRSVTWTASAPVNRSSGNEHFNYPRLPCGNVALDCPFINSKHRCVHGEFGCGTKSIRPLMVGVASCTTYWSSIASSLLRSVGALCTLSVTPLLHSSGRACYAQRRRG